MKMMKGRLIVVLKYVVVVVLRWASVAIAFVMGAVGLVVFGAMYVAAAIYRGLMR